MVVTTIPEVAMEDVSQILDQLSQATEPEEALGILEGIGPILSSQQERMKYKTYLETAADLNVVFRWLTSPPKASSQLTAVVNAAVSNLLEFLDPSVVLDKYWRQLVSILEDHKDPQVRRTVVRFLKRSGVDTRSCPDLTSALLRSLVDEDLGVAVDAKDVLHGQVVRDHSFATDVVFIGESSPLQELAQNKKETLRLRLYDFVVAVAKISPELAHNSCVHGLLQSLCSELFGTEDFLLQLNVLEMLVDLSQSDHGLAYLGETGVLSKVDNMLNQVSSSPYAPMLMPGFVKFFGRVAQKMPDRFVEDYPNFTQTLSVMLGNEGDDDLRTLALETLGFIATTRAGKRKLNDMGHLDIHSSLTRLLFRGTPDQKIKALSTIANILQGPDYPETPAENFYQALNLRAGETNNRAELSNNVMMDLLFDFIKQPFADAEPKVAYQVLVAMADKDWGLTKIASHPGMVEYLLDRSQLQSKEMKDARFELNKTLADNPAAAQVFQPQNHRKMQQYVREGPYYVDAQVQVALDEAS